MVVNAAKIPSVNARYDDSDNGTGLLDSSEQTFITSGYWHVHFVGIVALHIPP